jgi:hypothetical protein
MVRSFHSRLEVTVPAASAADATAKYFWPKSRDSGFLDRVHASPRNG